GSGAAAGLHRHRPYLPYPRAVGPLRLWLGDGKNCAVAGAGPGVCEPVQWAVGADRVDPAAVSAADGGELQDVRDLYERSGVLSAGMQQRVLGRDCAGGVRDRRAVLRCERHRTARVEVCGAGGAMVGVAVGGVSGGVTVCDPLDLGDVAIDM